jgi:hypothetical protein
MVKFVINNRFNQCHSNILVSFFPIHATGIRSFADYLHDDWECFNTHIHPPPTRLAPPLTVLTFIRWNVENVRGYEKAGRVDFLLMIKRAQFI